MFRGKNAGYSVLYCRGKMVIEYIRMVGVFEMEDFSLWTFVDGNEESLKAIRCEEEMISIQHVHSDGLKILADEMKSNSSVLGLRFYGEKHSSSPRIDADPIFLYCPNFSLVISNEEETHRAIVGVDL